MIELQLVDSYSILTNCLTFIFNLFSKKIFSLLDLFFNVTTLSLLLLTLGLCHKWLAQVATVDDSMISSYDDIQWLRGEIEGEGKSEREIITRNKGVR